MTPMSDASPKSAYELAMERLRKKDEDAGITMRALSDAEKAAIAEIRSFYEARIAERQVLHDSRSRHLADPAERELADAEWRRDRERLVEERDRKIEAVRRGEQP